MSNLGMVCRKLVCIAVSSRSKHLHAAAYGTMIGHQTVSHLYVTQSIQSTVLHLSLSTTLSVRHFITEFTLSSSMQLKSNMMLSHCSVFYKVHDCYNVNLFSIWQNVAEPRFQQHEVFITQINKACVWVVVANDRMYNFLPGLNFLASQLVKEAISK